MVMGCFGWSGYCENPPPNGCGTASNVCQLLLTSEVAVIILTRYIITENDEESETERGGLRRLDIVKTTTNGGSHEGKNRCAHVAHACWPQSHRDLSVVLSTGVEMRPSAAGVGALDIELGRNYSPTKGQPSRLELVLTEVGRVDDTPGVVTTISSSGDEGKRKSHLRVTEVGRVDDTPSVVTHLRVTEVGRVDDTPGVVTTLSSSGDEGKRKSHLGVTEVGRVDDTPGVVTTLSSSGVPSRGPFSVRGSVLGVTEVGRVDDTPGHIQRQCVKARTGARM